MRPESKSETQDDLQVRLRSLQIDRTPQADVRNRPAKWWMLAASVLAVALAAAVYFFIAPSHKTISTTEVRVSVSGGPAGSTVLSTSGYVVAHHKIEVGSKVMGRVSWIGVEKGDRVRAGQVLVRLEDGEFRAQMEEARANLAAAQARLDQLVAGSRPQEKLRDRAAALRAEAHYRHAQAEYERSATLFSAGVVSRAEMERLAAERDAARAQLEAERQASAMTDIGPRAEEVRVAMAQVQQMRATVSYAETQLAGTEIKAPVSGTVLQRIVERGEMVTPSAFGGSGARTSVVSLADLGDLQIELDISQVDFARLTMGQAAEIIPEAFPDLRYRGFIAEIAPEANRAKATVQVKVSVKNPDERLRPEMNVRVNFLAGAGRPDEARASRVMIPKVAVVNRDGTFVFVVKGAKVEQRAVRLGPDDGDAFQVLEGLVGGEVVATAGADRLSDGDGVSVSAPR